MFILTANDLFVREELLQGTPENAYRVACSNATIIMRVGDGALATEPAAGKVLYDKAHADSSAHPNVLYRTQSKAASSSTPNLSMLRRSVSPTPEATLEPAEPQFAYRLIEQPG